MRITSDKTLGLLAKFRIGVLSQKRSPAAKPRVKTGPEVMHFKIRTSQLLCLNEFGSHVRLYFLRVPTQYEINNNNNNIMMMMAAYFEAG